MSQIPPVSGSWTDPYGTVQSGFPPPGYWQASDGRWYPPESRPGEPLSASAHEPQPFAAPEDVTVAVGGPYGGPSPYGPPTAGTPPYGGQPVAGPPPYGLPVAGQPFPGAPLPGPQKSSRRGLWIVLGVVGVLFVGCGAVAVASAINGTTSDGTVGPDRATASTRTAITTPTASPDPTTEATFDFSSPFGVTEDGLDDITSCQRLDADRIAIDLTNSSSYTASYSLTVVLEDTPGQRLADAPTYIEALRPGERAVEEVYVYEERGSTCEVVSADRIATSSDPAALADVGTCQISDRDSFGYATASVTVTNSSATNTDYSLVVVVIDDSNVRRGVGYAYIDSVRPGESAPGDAYTAVAFDGSYSCEVVGVDRSES